MKIIILLILISTFNLSFQRHHLLKKHQSKHHSHLKDWGKDIIEQLTYDGQHYTDPKDHDKAIDCMMQYKGWNQDTENAYYVNTLHSSENQTDYNHYLFTIKSKEIGSNHRLVSVCVHQNMPDIVKERCIYDPCDQDEEDIEDGQDCLVKNLGDPEDHITKYANEKKSEPQPYDPDAEEENLRRRLFRFHRKHHKY